MIQIAVEGPHGVGKTTLIAHLSRTLQGSVSGPETVIDPLDALLEQFGEGIFVVNDIARSAGHKEWPTYHLLDRSALSTYVYQLAENGPAAAKAHLELTEQLVHAGVLRVPDLVLVLTAKASTITSRLTDIGRTMPEDYVRRQCAAYEHFLIDAEAQVVFGKATRIAVDPDVTPDQCAVAAIALINGERPPASEATPTRLNGSTW